MASSIALIVGVLSVGGGLYGMYWGRKRRHAHELVTETPTTEVGNLRDTGIVELKGTARTVAEGPSEESFVSPIGQREETLVSAWKVEEWDERGDHSNWRTIAAGIWSVPFVVDDGTGEVVVEAGDHADKSGWFSGVSNIKASDGVSFGDVMTEFRSFPVAQRVGAEDPSPGHIRQFVSREGSVDAQSGSITNVIDVGNAHGDRKYYEQTINAGDDVYVLGRAYPRSENPTRPLGPDDLVVTPPHGADDGMLIVSDEREEDITSQTGRYRFAMAAGVLAILVGVALLAGGAGTI